VQVVERSGDAAGRRELVFKYSKGGKGRDVHMPLSLYMPWKLIQNYQAVAVTVPNS